jgi:hypothetical protein
MDGLVTGGAIFAVVVLLAVVAGASLLKFKPLPLNHTYFDQRWQEVLALFKEERTTWPLAVINADKLLDDALKKRRFRGKTMGERMVSAQKWFSNNDSVWYGHKLRNRLVHEADTTKLREADVKQALDGFRRALKDLGAMK